MVLETRSRLVVLVRRMMIGSYDIQLLLILIFFNFDHSPCFCAIFSVFLDLI